MTIDSLHPYLFAPCDCPDQASYRDAYTEHEL